MPKISLLCAAYNMEKYIRQTIDSVLDQSLPDFEFLIYDDNSTDNTLNIIRSYNDSRIRVFHDGENKGLVARIYMLFEKSRGEYIGGLDADDYLEKRALELTSSVLDQFPDYGVVYSDCYEVTASGDIIGLYGLSKIPYSKERLLATMIPFNFRLHRRELLDRINPLSSNVRLCFDYEMCLRLSEITQFKHLPLPLYYYRKTPGSLSDKYYNEMIEESALLVREAIARRGLNLQVDVIYENDIARYEVRDQEA